MSQLAMKMHITFRVTFGRSFDSRQKFRFCQEHLPELLPSSTVLWMECKALFGAPARAAYHEDSRKWGNRT
eukprot:815812-Rhodomonas_salina.1